MSYSPFISKRLGATLPWKSLDAYTDEDLRKHEPRSESQAEIDACLNCPFDNCSGLISKCRSFRAHYIAKLEHVE